jgi:CBS domain-containing protein
MERKNRPVCLVADGVEEALTRDGASVRIFAFLTILFHEDAAEEDDMVMQGVPAGGFRTLGEIDVALELLSSHETGAPIVNDAGSFIGFVSEFDLLGAIEAGQDLGKITADKIMNKEHYVADASTKISDAICLMNEKHLLNIPVIKQGQVAYSVTRHDLLRARIGLGPGIEE